MLGKFGAPAWSGTDQPPSETDQRNRPPVTSCPSRACVGVHRAHDCGTAAATMSALPLIEAVHRAGGTITLRGEQLRLSAPEPLPGTSSRRSGSTKRRCSTISRHCAGLGAPRERRPSASPVETTSSAGVEVLAACARCRRLRAIRSTPGPSSSWTPGASWTAGEHRRRVSAGRPGSCSAATGARPGDASRAWGWCCCCAAEELVALTETEAVIRTPTGAHQTYRRKPHDPLHPAERCLVWELGDA